MDVHFVAILINFNVKTYHQLTHMCFIIEIMRKNRWFIFHDNKNYLGYGSILGQYGQTFTPIMKYLMTNILDIQ